MFTFDNTNRYDGQGNHMGTSLHGSFLYRTHDGKTVTVDSTGAFLVGELERLDLTLNEPLVDVTWGRDIDLREDVTIADEVSSFTKSDYASAGGLGTGNGIGNGKAWLAKDTGQVSGIGLDIEKTPHPLRPWGLELKYTIFELESAAKLGRPIDSQKYEALQQKHQMDIDEQVYIGDTTTSDTGILNDAGVTAQNFPVGGSGSTAWSQKSPDEILADVNFSLTQVWKSSAWATMPQNILMPPDQFGYISQQKVSAAGNVSILKYIMENNVVTASGRGKLSIQPLKWCIGSAAGGTVGTSDGHDRLLVYTKNKKYVRYPMTLLQRTQLQYEGLFQKTVYFCRLGCVETPYPETMGYFDLL